MRLILKPFKLILKIIIGILIIPAIFLAFLYRSVEVPKDDYAAQSVTVESVITDSVDEFLDNDVDRKPLSFTLDSSVANKEIREQILAQFEATATPGLDYVYEDGRILFQGVWIDFKKDTLTINAGVHIDLNLFKFKTSVLMRFVVVDNDGIIELKLTKFNIGRIPLAWTAQFASQIMKKVTNIDLETMIEEQLGSMAEFDIKARTLKVDLRLLAEQAEENQEMIKMLIDLIYAEKLIDFGIKAHGDKFAIGLYLNLEKIEDRLAALTIDEADKIKTDAELELFLESIIGLDNDGILSTLLTAKPEVRLSELEINQALDYFLSASLGSSNDGIMQQLEIYDGYDVLLLTPYLSLAGDITSLNLPVRFVKYGGKEFMTTLKLGVDISVTGKDLILQIKKLDFGELSIDESYIEEIMNFFASGGDVGGMVINGSKLELKDFADNFENIGLVFNNLKVDNGDLVLEYSLPLVTDALIAIKESLELNLSDDLKDQITDVLDNPTEESVTDLIASFENLPEAEQQAIFDALMEAFGDLIP